MNIIEQLIIFGGGIFAGILGGLLGIGGGIVLMPILWFFVGLSPTVAAGTCILAVFFATLGGSFRHYKLGHVKIKSILPVIIAGAIFTPLEIKPRCSAAGLGFIIIPAGFNAPLEFLTGFTCFSGNAFFSALLKFFQGFVYLPVALPICLGTVIGSNIGAVLNKRFPSSVLKILFGIAFSYVSYQYSLVFFQGRS